MTKLTPFETYVLDQKGTEPAHSGLYTHHAARGAYVCKKCQTPLYRSEDKFASHCGWPSFDDEIPGRIQKKPDADGRRTEILCQTCGAHLGHVFEGEGFTSKNLRHCVNSVSLDFVPAQDAAQAVVYLASGCFWGTQFYLGRIPGVIETKVGYMGGHTAHPTYQDVCTGTTGHVETVAVRYDPTVVSLEEVIRVFFETHDFSQTDGQGPDIGSQYLSVIFYQNETEQRLAQKVMEELSTLTGRPIATSLRPAQTFYGAEDYHQLYYERKGDTPYCHRYQEIFPRPKSPSLR